MTVTYAYGSLELQQSLIHISVMIDVRFATGLQVMLRLALAQAEGVEWVSSAKLASGVGANPSLVRKLLVPLVRAGLAETAHGRDGGVRLAKPAAKIGLREIYLSTNGSKGVWTARADVPHQCLVSSNVEAFFGELAAEADQAVLATLEGRTLADSLARLRCLDAAIR